MPNLIRFLSSLLLTCLVTLAVAQVTISGKVVTSAGNAPVANASVYINNTFAGTTTNDAGEFTLQAGYSGGFDIVVSHIAFEKKVVHINADESANKILIRVEARSSALAEVMITDKTLKNWKKWRSLFIEHFIGNMPFAKRCTIKNPEVLRFHYDKTTRVLKVTSNTPLLIENNALGYLYKIDLNSFIYSFSTLRVSSDVTTFFQKIAATDPARQKSFITNREIAFNGSKMHFLQALYKKDYPQQGFSIVSIHLEKNPEKLWIQHLISDALAKAYSENRNANSVTLTSIANGNRDTVRYYEQILGLPDFIIRDTTSIALKDSLVFDRKYQKSSMHLKDTLLIQYTENHGIVPVPLKLPVKYARIAITDQQLFVHNKKQTTIQYSVLLLTPGNRISIYPNGGYDGDEILTVGYMANGKIAYLLPWDYKPGD